MASTVQKSSALNEGPDYGRNASPGPPHPAVNRTAERLTAAPNVNHKKTHDFGCLWEI